jgi:hypothetical protein
VQKSFDNTITSAACVQGLFVYAREASLEGDTYPTKEGEDAF